MDTSVLKNFAQESRRYLMDVVSKKIEYYLTTDNVDVRAKKHLVEELKKEISNTSKEQVIEKIAYTWFNRFCALRYMDVKQYSLVGILTPMSESHTQPEILMEAKSGHIKDELGNPSSRDNVFGLLSGKVSSSDPQSEAYKLLVLMACNYYHSIMPFLFEKIDDYTEVLMPDDLLSEASIISKVREALNDENCKDVEVIGWLYQFYISEKKDEVFEGLKKNKKITPENIPAATQLFTPNWIVRYLVENSLGRLWMLNRPKSNLVSQMEYYIKTESEENDFLKIKGPEEIKVCDPACGSGHMLVYAFDLLYLMYEEEGIDSNEIPSLILKNNLFGIEIDKRAGELAAFALTMKAREKQRRYFRNPVNPNVCVLENIHFEVAEIKDYMDHVGHDLFSAQLRNTFIQFEEAKNFGSLIRPEVTDVENVLEMLDQKNVSGHLFLAQTHAKVLKVLSQVKFLSPTYHVVIANPPYMGGKGMNGRMGAWLKENYSDVKSDLFSAFMVRNTELALSKGQLGFMTPFVWMFISSYEKLRNFLIEKKTFTSLVQLEYSGFDGATVPICTFTLENDYNPDFKGGYVRLSNFRGSENQAPRTLEAIKNPKCDWFYRASTTDFKKIPGSPIAYWAKSFFSIFENSKKLDEIAIPCQGLATTNNNRFVRLWFEVEYVKCSWAQVPQVKKWFPYNKGGDFRRWYGNQLFVVNWKNSGKEIKDLVISRYGNAGKRVVNEEKYFVESLTWSKIGSSLPSFRFQPAGAIFDVAGMSMFPEEKYKLQLLGLLNSKVAEEALKILSPTLNFEAGQISSIPIKFVSETIDKLVLNAIEISTLDWNEYELSWNFTGNPILNQSSLSSANSIRLLLFEIEKRFNKRTNQLKEIEEEINLVFLQEYGLKNYLSHEVSLKEISLRCNPFFRYPEFKGTSDQIRRQFNKDQIIELISYGVGCIMGRYLFSDAEKFAPDEDNVVPFLEGDWFVDDIVNKFKKFIAVYFGKDSLDENILTIEELIEKDLKNYFLKDFYNDHIRFFKNRPIYWMFSSPKGTFNALIYIHRYTPDTVSIVLNSYLREFRTKLNSKRENLERLSVAEATSARDKTAAIKEIEQLKKMIVELDEYEKDILYPLATQRLEIDLDDGVKVNYPKFGKALKPIKGLEEDED